MMRKIKRNKDKRKKYLIKVTLNDKKSLINKFFLDDIVLYGIKEVLIEQMKSLDFVNKLGINESLYFELVPEDEVAFPEHEI